MPHLPCPYSFKCGQTCDLCRNRGWGWAPTTVKVMLYKTNFRLDSKLSLDVLDEISFQKDTAESPGQPVAHREKLRASVFASL